MLIDYTVLLFYWSCDYLTCNDKVHVLSFSLLLRWVSWVSGLRVNAHDLPLQELPFIQMGIISTQLLTWLSLRP